MNDKQLRTVTDKYRYSIERKASHKILIESNNILCESLNLLLTAVVGTYHLPLSRVIERFFEETSEWVEITNIQDDDGMIVTLSVTKPNIVKYLAEQDRTIQLEIVLTSDKKFISIRDSLRSIVSRLRTKKLEAITLESERINLLNDELNLLSEMQRHINSTRTSIIPQDNL